MANFAFYYIFTIQYSASSAAADADIAAANAAADAAANTKLRASCKPAASYAKLLLLLPSCYCADQLICCSAAIKAAAAAPAAAVDGQS